MNILIWYVVNVKENMGKFLIRTETFCARTSRLFRRRGEACAEPFGIEFSPLFFLSVGRLVDMASAIVPQLNESNLCHGKKGETEKK